MKHQALVPKNHYKYDSKELQDEFGLNELDFGARFYDPAIARWAQLDPLAEGAADWTPYRYAFNNPMGYSDPSGMFEMPKGQFPDGFDNGSGLHLPWESSGSWSSSFGGVGSINGHYNYYCTNNAQEPVYDGGASNGYVYNEITKTYQKDGQDVPFSEVLASMSENGSATQGLMDYVWRSNATGEIAPPGSDLKNSYRSLEVVDSGIPVAEGGGWVDPTNKWNGGFGVLAGAIEHGVERVSIGTNLKFYSSGWHGNQYVRTLRLARAGKLIGLGTLGLGTALDLFGVFTYYKYGVNDPNAVNPAKASLNFGVGLWGLLGPANAIGAAGYYLIDNFYPGKWTGWSDKMAEIRNGDRNVLGYYPKD